MSMEEDLEKHFHRAADKHHRYQEMADAAKEQAKRSLELGVMMKFTWAEKIKERVEAPETPNMVHWGEARRAKIEASARADEDHDAKPGMVVPDDKGISEVWCEREGCGRVISQGPLGRWYHAR